MNSNPLGFIDPEGLVARKAWNTTKEVANTSMEYWGNKAVYAENTYSKAAGQVSNALNSGYKSLSQAGQQGYNSMLDSLPGAQAPDNDGHLALGEANYQYRHGNGPVTVDINKIDFSGVSAAQAHAGASPKGISYVYPSNINDYLVHGSVGVRVGANNTITAPTAAYDFDIQNFQSDFSSLNGIEVNAKICVRNIETIIGNIYAGFGTKYDINYAGQGKVGP